MNPGTPPGEDLILALRGTAYFLRWLSRVSEDNSGGNDLSRARVISTVGYDARGFARIAEAVRRGDESPRSFDSEREREETIRLGTCLPHHALQHLVEHSAVQLSVEWRDLPDDRWDEPATIHDGRPTTPRETVWARARQVWLGAIDLENGASFADLPNAALHRLVLNEVSALDELIFTVRDQSTWSIETADSVVSGAPADIARYLTGRGERRLSRRAANPRGSAPSLRSTVGKVKR